MRGFPVEAEPLNLEAGLSSLRVLLTCCDGGNSEELLTKVGWDRKRVYVTLTVPLGGCIFKRKRRWKENYLEVWGWPMLIEEAVP